MTRQQYESCFEARNTCEDQCRQMMGGGSGTRTTSAGMAAH